MAWVKPGNPPGLRCVTAAATIGKEPRRLRRGRRLANDLQSQFALEQFHNRSRKGAGDNRDGVC